MPDSVMHDSVMPDSSLLLCQIPDSNFHVMPDSVMPLSVIPLSTFLLWLIPLWQIPLCSFLILKIIPDSVMPHYVMPKSVMTGSPSPLRVGSCSAGIAGERTNCNCCRLRQIVQASGFLCNVAPLSHYSPQGDPLRHCSSPSFEMLCRDREIGK